jgi:hypothetical protein
MRPATSPESAADPIARAVANRAGAVLDRTTAQPSSTPPAAALPTRLPAPMRPSPRSGRPFGPRWPSV